MAYKRVWQRFDDEWYFVADSSDDLTTIEAENPNIPIGSIVITSSSEVFVNFPTDGFVQIGGSSGGE